MDKTLLIKAEIRKQLYIRGWDVGRIAKEIGYTRNTTYNILGYVGRVKHPYALHRTCKILGIDPDKVSDRPLTCSTHNELRAEAVKWMWYNQITESYLSKKYGYKQNNISAYLTGRHDSLIIADVISAELHIPFDIWAEGVRKRGKSKDKHNAHL